MKNEKIKCPKCGSDRAKTFYPRLAYNSRTYCVDCGTYIPYKAVT